MSKRSSGSNSSGFHSSGFQLPLAIRPDDSATFANFYVLPKVALVVGELQRMLADKNHAYLYLCAIAGSGKSHLLQACVQQAAQSGLAALYLPLAELQDYSPDDVLASAAGFEFVALDDLQAVIADPQWQAALFRFYNDCRDQHRKLLIASDRPVNELDCALADLQSRLGWGGIFRLPIIDDEGRAKILQHRAAQLGLVMEDDVVRFVLSRAARDLSELMQILNQLDQASLSQQRKLTLPFVKQIMGW
jgi:DnaA family protein